MVTDLSAAARRPMSGADTLCAERETNVSNSCAAAVHGATGRQKGQRKEQNRLVQEEKELNKRRLLLRRGEARRRSDASPSDVRLKPVGCWKVKTQTSR